MDATFRPETVARFWSKVNKQGPVHPQLGTECWLWTASRIRRDYGQFSNCGSVRAHRFSWMLHNGSIPPDLRVCHHCDNPPCVNPAHLFIGTDGDNQRDKFSKGREPAQCRRRSHCAKGHDMAEHGVETMDNGKIRVRCRVCRGALMEKWLSVNHGAKLEYMRKYNAAKRARLRAS